MNTEERKLESVENAHSPEEIKLKKPYMRCLHCDFLIGNPLTFNFMICPNCGLIFNNSYFEQFSECEAENHNLGIRQNARGIKEGT